MFEEFKDTNDNTNSIVIEKYYSRLQAMSREERLIKCLNLCNATREFVLAGIMHRYPGISDHELRKRYAALTLGSDFTRKYLDWDPEKEG